MDFNIPPYYDDFEATKQFYKVLFRPGVGVQTREVNQLQSILQDQISKVGNHLFKEGSMVIPGQVNYNAKLKYLKLGSVNLGTLTLADLEDQQISNTADGTGVIATVVKAIDATDTDPATLVLLYTQSNQTVDGVSADTQFIANSTLYVLSDTTKTITVGSGVVSGRSVAAGLQAGVYFLSGTFVSVPSAVLSVKKYADSILDINVRIGIQYTEEIITEDTDASLYDNALGAPNYAAPGAHRFKISTKFIQVGLNESPVNFFELLRVEEGVLQSIVNASQYNILEETLARRTFDEAGNYVVDDFKFDIREARNSDQGTWAPTKNYSVSDIVKNAAGTRQFTCLVAGTSGSAEPANFNNGSDESVLTTDGTAKWRYVKSPSSNRGYDVAGSSSNLVATFGLGKAYVHGYEVSKISNSALTIPKARDTVFVNNQSIPVFQGNYIYVDKKWTYGIPDISTGPIVQLYDRLVYKGSGNKFGQGNIVGTARIGWTEPDSRGFIKVGLNNIIMYPNKSFDRDVNSVAVPASTTSYTATAYTASGVIKYAGNNTSSYLQVGGLLQSTSQGATAMIVTSNALTAYNTEIIVGDRITFGTSSHATTCSWVVTSIINSSTMVLSGPPITQAAGATTSIFVLFPVQTVFGHQTGTATRFQSEFRIGDTVWMGTATGSSTATSMVVTGITNESRMTVSSNASNLIAQTSLGLYYVARSASFAADVAENYQIGINARKLTGLVYLTDYLGTNTAVASSTALRLNGNTDSKFLVELTTNDLIDVNGYKILVTKISSNTVAYGICTEQAITPLGSSNGATYSAFKLTNTLNETNANSLLFPTVPTVLSNLADNVFTVYKTTSVAITIGATSVALSLLPASGNDAAEAASTADPGSYFVAQDGVSTLSGPITVNSVSIVGSTITLGINSSSSTSVRVTYPVTRAAASQTQLGRLKTKTLVLADSSGSGAGFDDFMTTSAATKAILYLSRADIYRKVKIYMADNFYASWNSTIQANATDVTSRYELDNGQRAFFYDVGSMRLISGYPQATGSIRVYYDYFDHGTGDFFAKPSYSLPYENIPTFNNLNLGDLLDFRTKVDPATGLLQNSSPPRYGTNFVADTTYYLGRKEKVLLDRNGVFYNVAGVSGLNPAAPKTTESENSVEMYDIELSPYTPSVNLPDVKKKKYDNRRYTMKDIGGIEKRVTNLEEATALSLLETKASTLQIRDNKDSTLERYKTGFFVDNYADDSNSEIGGDARFSIDTTNRTLNTQVEYYKFHVNEKLNFNPSLFTSSSAASNSAGRLGQNYAITGDLLTLSYTTGTVLTQGLATTSIAVAPFITATFLGSLRVVPDKDIYEDVHNKTAITESINNTNPQALAAMVAAYRAHDRRPYRVDTVTVNTYVDTTKTSFLIPFCRANTILMIGKGLKPNAKFYPYFDDSPVQDYVTGAMKFTFSALPIIDFEGSSPKVKTEWPRWRSLYESADVKEVVRARQVITHRLVWMGWGWGWGGWGFLGTPWNYNAGWGWFGWGGYRTMTSTSWVYDYGWFRRTLNPQNFDGNLPSAAGRDTFRPALGIGTSVWYYEGSTCVGSGVGVYQEGATLYIVNGRGKLAESFLRNAGSYNYTGKFYISVENSDARYLPTTLVSAASCLTSDASGYLYTNGSGVAVGIFDLPNTDTVKFTTGKKPVTLTDDPNNDPDNWTSKADGLYTVEGYDVTFTKNYISTKNYVLRPYDPIAQSFKLPSQYTDGAFITDIDVFFQAKPVSEPATVSLELRSCDSTGRPSGTEMIPGSEVTLRPDQINVDATKGQVATKFTFRQPIYLMPDKNYAFVLRSDTKNYRVWMATMGQQDVNDPTKSYTTQALFGSLFKSQDGTLWTEDQTSDLKFNINRAIFSTVDTGADAYVVNSAMAAEQLPSNPLTFVHGSNKIRVGHRNHGFSSGDTTRLYSQYWAGQYALLGATAKINGIPVGEIFGAYVSSDTTTFRPDNADATQPKLIVSDVTLDTYTVTVSSVANIANGTTGFTAVTGGGDDLFGHKNFLYHVVKPTASVLKTPPTSITFNATMAKGFTYDTDANSTPAQYPAFTQTLSLNDYNILDTSSAVLSDVVEYSRMTPNNITTGGVSANWTDSFIGKIHMTSTSDAVSPAVDMSTFTLELMQHRIDNPSYTNRLPVTLPATPAIGSSAMILMTTVVSSNTTVTFDGTQRKIITGTAGLFNDIVPGRYILVSGSSVVGNTYSSTGLLVLNVTPDGTQITVSGSLVTSQVADAITIRQIDDYCEEATTFNASGESKYITNMVNLKNPATQIKLQLEVCCPSQADFDIYYKTAAAGADYSTVIWNKYVAPNQIGTTSSYTNLVKTDKRGNFTDVEFDICTYDSTGVPVDLQPFTSFQIKIVMRSTNAARVPQFRNMRVIAHA